MPKAASEGVSRTATRKACSQDCSTACMKRVKNSDIVHPFLALFLEWSPLSFPIPWKSYGLNYKLQASTFRLMENGSECPLKTNWSGLLGKDNFSKVSLPALLKSLSPTQLLFWCFKRWKNTLTIRNDFLIFFTFSHKFSKFP